MRQPFARAAIPLDTFDELYELNGPWFAVFEIPKPNNEPPSYISLTGAFYRGAQESSQIVAKEHAGHESMMMETSAYRKSQTVQNQQVFKSVALSDALIKEVITSQSLLSYINPEGVPERLFPMFTDTRMALMALSREMGIEADLGFRP